jgi:seryl-tRNA(Sec) selenium transferase
MTNFNNAAHIQDLSSSISSPKAGKIQYQEWLGVAHQQNIPCLIDVASDMPPIDTLWKYTGMGFDLVAVSGGKGISGPQNAGILMGKKRLTDLAVVWPRAPKTSLHLRQRNSTLFRQIRRRNQSALSHRRSRQMNSFS